MKKITFILIILAVVLASCQKNSYTIEGNFAENTFDGETIYLQKIDSMTAESSTAIDSTILKDGKFKFSGSAEDHLSVGFISVGRLESPVENSPVATFILETGSIKIAFDKRNVSISGTPKNEDYNKVLAAMNKMGSLYEEVEKAGGVQGVAPDENGLDIMGRMQKLQEELQEVSFDFTKANIANKLGEFLFFSYASIFTKDQLKELLPLADSTFRSQPQIQMLEKELNRVIPEIGQPYQDTQLVTTEGMPVLLSEYIGKNKCVLIDFWASWCAPCIQEIPHLRKAYSAYKSKGLEIIGISVDEDRVAWMDAIKKHNMDWIQLGDDTRNASAIYGVSSIPHTVLVDQTGTIIAKNLRGKELEDKIAEVLK
jgi:Peroxiredoxin